MIRGQKRKGRFTGPKQTGATDSLQESKKMPYCIDIMIAVVVTAVPIPCVGRGNVLASFCCVCSEVHICPSLGNTSGRTKRGIIFPHVTLSRIR